MEEQAQSATGNARKPRRKLVGTVRSAKTDKTRRVDVERQAKHPIYGKYLRRRTVCYVHDEKNESKEGDTVEIMESRPLSKTKRWRLVRVLKDAVESEAAPQESAPQE